MKELLQELQQIVFGNRNIIDIVLPPILFLALVRWAGFAYAVWGALGLAILLLVWRLARRQPILAAVGGVAGVLLSLALVQILKLNAGTSEHKEISEDVDSGETDDKEVFYDASGETEDLHHDEFDVL
ncbi:MAG: DUF3159 domain-containing protein [Chloroflexota bacterium]